MEEVHKGLDYYSVDGDEHRSQQVVRANEMITTETVTILRIEDGCNRPIIVAVIPNDRTVRRIKTEE